MKKRILSIFLALAMVMTGLYITQPEAKEVQATETALLDILSVKMQVSGVDNKGTEDTSDDTRDLRLVSSVDSLAYSEVGFEVWYHNDIQVDTNGSLTTEPTATFKTQTVLERIKAGVSYKFSPKVINVASEYFVTGTLKDIKVANLDNHFYVRAYCKSTDGSTTYYGIGRHFNVNEATAANIINMPFVASALPSGATVGQQDLGMWLGGYNTTAEIGAIIDGYAHVNMQVPAAATKTINGEQVADKTNLASVSKVYIPNTSTWLTPYRNWESKLVVNDDGTVTGDDTWYQIVGSSATAYVISTAADLYGLAERADHSTDPFVFNGKTIYLCADIDVNLGTASEDGWSKSYTAIENGEAVTKTGTDYLWNPIGKTNYFAGIFNGQGHSISGLNVDATTAAVGLFAGTTVDSKILNLKIDNSYFKWSSSSTAVAYLGSVVGDALGEIKNVQSSAILDATNAQFVGGFVGNANKGNKLHLESCCFDGKIMLNYTGTGNYEAKAGGFVGGSYNSKLKFDTCLFSGEINIVYSKAENLTSDVWTTEVGGFIGRSAINKDYECDITNSLSAGTIVVDCQGATSYSTSLSLVHQFAGRLQMQSGGTITYTNICNATRVILKTLGGETIYDAANNLPTQTNHDHPINAAYGGDTATISNQAIMQREDLIGAGSNVLTNLYFATSGSYTGPIWQQRHMMLPAPKALPNVEQQAVDTSWYDANATEMTIDSAADLYGLYYVADNITENQTVKLGRDIVLNTGDAEDWAVIPPENQWTPISSFAGTFNGNNHIISGLYVDSTAQGVGLFAQTEATSKILNLKIDNSYFKWTASSVTAAWVGSVVGIAQGEIKNVQSNAIIDATNAKTVGGLVGYGIGNSLLLESCCFDGTLTLNYTGTGNYFAASGGLMGASKSKLTTFDTCLFSGEVKVVYPATGDLGGTDWCAQVGGFIGVSDNDDAYMCNISNSLSAGTITLDYQSANSIPTSVSMVQQFAGRLMGGTNANKNQFKNICGASTVVLKTPSGSTTYSVGNGNYVEQVFSESPLTTAVSAQSYKDRTELIGASISNLYFANSASYTGPIWVVRTGNIPVPATLYR